VRQIEVADFAALARHAPATAAALVEQMHREPRRREGVGRRQAGHALPMMAMGVFMTSPRY